MAESQFDGVVLDTEHGHFNNETLFNCIQVITLSNKKCFVRVTDLNKQLIRMCLDAGVDSLDSSHRLRCGAAGRCRLRSLSGCDTNPCTTNTTIGEHHS